MIDYQFIEKEEMPLEGCTDWVKYVVASENKKLGDIIFVFCNDDYLLEKNITFLKHNTLTDVIAFDYSKGQKITGDILISIDRVQENSKIFEVSFLNELYRVMVHGLLHLLGYNDKNQKDAILMKSKENYYLSNK